MRVSRSRLVLALVLALTPMGAAGEEAALEVVRETLAAAREVANGEGTRDEKLESLRGVARGILDTRAMGRRAGGDALAGQTTEVQEEYFELFDHVIVRAYLSKLLLFRKPRFGYRKPRREGDVVIVGSKVITTKDEYYVDYEMRERDGRWVATDVIVEGISLSDNYYEQFSSLLRGRSFEELLDLMRRKTRRVREEPA
jgi:phospholipid transport system substrate-binding protein